VIPPFAGLFSTLGLLSAGFELSHVRSCLAPLDDTAALREHVEAACRQARERYAAGGNPADSLRLEVSADIRYRSQSSHLTLPVPAGGEVGALVEAFHAEHLRSFGYASP